MEKDISLFSSPFSADPDTAPNQLQLELIELQWDDELRGRKQQLSLLSSAGKRQIPRNANICKENAELVRLHLFVRADILL